MKQRTKVYYDEEGDILEVIIGKPTISYMKDLGNEIFERIDEKTGKIKGFLIVGFKKRCERKFMEEQPPADLSMSA